MTQNKRDEIVEAYGFTEFLFADGFDDAIIGVEENSLRVVYDVDKVIGILIEGGMDAEEAVEFYEFNIAGAYVGERTPIFVMLH
jgi:hypothetical protein